MLYSLCRKKLLSTSSQRDRTLVFVQYPTQKKCGHVAAGNTKYAAIKSPQKEVGRNPSFILTTKVPTDASFVHPLHQFSLEQQLDHSPDIRDQEQNPQNIGEKSWHNKKQASRQDTDAI